MAAAAMAAVASFVAVARGEVLCLCDEDPDGCGEPCHECHEGEPSHTDGLSEPDTCAHLDLSATDLTRSEVKVRLPTAELAPLPAVLAPVTVSRRRVSIPCQTSPPDKSRTFCRFSFRLMPRS